MFESTEAMDDAVQQHAQALASYNPEALSLLKKIFWEGAGHWDKLLPERAELSGKLVLSDFTRNAIDQFKQK